MATDYDITFLSDTIDTTVTNTPSCVDSWIAEIESNHYRSIVGLDVEWRPSFSTYESPVATLQLCVGRRCLIFQIIHAPFIPVSLRSFLGNRNYTFVGVGIGQDVEKITRNYGLVVANTVDLRGLAADEYGRRELRNCGLKDLAPLVLGKEIDKPRNITMSRWDERWLQDDQVRYACIDAFVSYEIGRCLNAAG